MVSRKLIHTVMRTGGRGLKLFLESTDRRKRYVEQRRYQQPCRGWCWMLDVADSPTTTSTTYWCTPVERAAAACRDFPLSKKKSSICTTVFYDFMRWLSNTVLNCTAAMLTSLTLCNNHPLTVLSTTVLLRKRIYKISKKRVPCSDHFLNPDVSIAPPCHLSGGKFGSEPHAKAE